MERVIYMGKLIIEGNNIYEIDDECDQERNHRSQREQNLPKETPEVNEQNRKTNQISDFQTKEKLLENIDLQT